MSKRSAAYASELKGASNEVDAGYDDYVLSAQVEHVFPIRWETFQEDLLRERGFVDFLIVDDFTSLNLWDDLLLKGIARVGIRPEGYLSGACSTMNDLPEGKWRMLHAMRPLAADELYARAGVTKPCETKLPAVYCLVHGQTTGSCMFNARLDSAVEFIRSKIEFFLAANDDDTFQKLKEVDK